MKENELQNEATELNEQISGLTDLEPIGEIVGGTKVGGGTVIFPAANTYTGLTTVNEGILSLDSRPGSGIFK